MWMLANCKNGISSYELARNIGVTQKSAWFMLHRIREAMKSGSILKTDGNGPIEIDETHIGPKPQKLAATSKLVSEPPPSKRRLISPRLCRRPRTARPTMIRPRTAQATCTTPTR